MSIVKVMRYEIIKPVSSDWSTFGQYLRDVQYAVWKTYNRAIQMTWDFQQFAFGYRERFGNALGFADLGTGRKAQSSDIYEAMSAEFPNVSTSTLDCTIRSAQQRFKALSSDVLNGRASIPSYKRDCPIPIRAQQTRIYRDEVSGDYVISLALLSASYAKQAGVPSRYDVKIKTRGEALAILKRLVSGEYALGDSQIIHAKSKWYVNLTYKFEPANDRILDAANVMGVDLGVVNAAAIAFNNDRARYFIGGSEIQAFRDRIEARRNEYLRQGPYCGNGRRGHGRTKRLQPIEKLQDRVANFRATTNHRYARFIVEKALAHRCATIQIEDLAGVSDRSTFLKSWPYYDLQTKIADKAKEYGIDVVKIPAHYTSQRCSCCGHIAEDNRPSQAEFKCVACGFSANADYNAARNISTPRIGEIIAEEMRRVKRKAA